MKDKTMMKTAPVGLRVEPKQMRAERRIAQLRAAAVEVLETVGRDRLSTQAVADAAGCSIGTLYRYYDDRVAILDDLYPNRVEGLTGAPEGDEGEPDSGVSR